MNSRHLELYSVMAEHDNTGFPLSYCLLSTVTTIDLGKQTKALTAWAKCLKDKYGVNPKFVHVDKDMVEIGMVRVVWNAKISLCWWHLRRAVCTWLTNGKLSTTPYNVARARAEFLFIDFNFKPKGKADPKEFEGRAHANANNNEQASATTTTAASSSTATLPQIPHVMFVLPQSSNPTPKAAAKPTLTEDFASSASYVDGTWERKLNKPISTCENQWWNKKETYNPAITSTETVTCQRDHQQRTRGG